MNITVTFDFDRKSPQDEVRELLNGWRRFVAGEWRGAVGPATINVRRD